MSSIDLSASLERARARLGGKDGEGARRRRRDRGEARIDARVEAQIARLLSGQRRPVLSEVHRRLAGYCAERGLRTPSRSSLYNAMERVPVPAFAWPALPPAVRRSLYNLGPGAPDARVAGDVVVFYAFNHGEPRALSFAAGMPWLCLVRAASRSGWRRKSLSLLRAVMAWRGLS